MARAGLNRSKPAEVLKEAKKIHPVGDCVEPRKVGDAINDAYVLAFGI